MDYKDIIKLSPYPVKMEHIGSWAGWFSWGDGTHEIYQHPNYKPYIKIDECLDSVERMAVLIHEVGHAIHYQRHCKCMCEHNEHKRQYLVELHAYRFALRFMIKHNLLDALQYEYDKMIESTDFLPSAYCRVFKKIKTEELWQKVKKTLDIVP